MLVILAPPSDVIVTNNKITLAMSFIRMINKSGRKPWHAHQHKDTKIRVHT